VVAMYSKRLDTFIKNKEPLETDVLSWSNRISSRLGVTYPVGNTIPLIQVSLEYKIYVFLAMHVDCMLNACVE